MVQASVDWKAPDHAGGDARTSQRPPQQPAGMASPLVVDMEAKI